MNKDEKAYQEELENWITLKENALQGLNQEVSNLTEHMYLLKKQIRLTEKSIKLAKETKKI